MTTLTTMTRNRLQKTNHPRCRRSPPLPLTSYASPAMWVLPISLSSISLSLGAGSLLRLLRLPPPNTFLPAKPMSTGSQRAAGEVISLRLLSGPTRDPYCTVLGSLVYRDQYDSFLLFVLSCNLHSNTGFLFAVVVATPVILSALNRDPKLSMSVANTLLIVGSWIRYGVSRANHGQGLLGLLVFGQVLIGFAQPFVLIAPTRYSGLWFSDKGRVTATALATLANPSGGVVSTALFPS